MNCGSRACLFVATALSALLISGCGGAGGGSNNFQTPGGSVVAFGADTPICDIESFTATITSASLVPQGGGQPVSLITSAAPATVDFARLADFTNILATASNVAPGTYSQLQVSLTNPQLTGISTATSPPSNVNIPATLSSTSLTINITPALVVTSNVASGLIFDFNLRKSLAVDNTGQVTGVVNAQIKATPTVASGSTIGEADSLYGIVQSTSTSNLPSGFTGSFALTLGDGTGQTLTVLSNSSTTFEGNNVTQFSDLQSGTFVEVDAIVNTSGQIVAQIVDAEEQASAADQKSAFLGRIISITRDGAGNATSFTLLVGAEIPSMASSIPLHSGLNVTLDANTLYFTNWAALWSQDAFHLSPTTLGVAERVAVFGVLSAGTSPTLTASAVFLRPRNVVGNFTSLLAAQSDDHLGGFTMVPCGALFGGNPITVVTYHNTDFSGVGGLDELTAAPTINTRGLLFYEQTNGSSNSGARWTAPTWVLRARQVHQLPN